MHKPLIIQGLFALWLGFLLESENEKIDCWSHPVWSKCDHAQATTPSWRPKSRLSRSTLCPQDLHLDRL